MATKKDPDRADERQGVQASTTFTADDNLRVPVADAAPARETPKQALSRRVKGARFLGGQWLAADGTPLTDVEAQAAHRAMDAEAAEARRRAVLGVQE